MLSAIFGLRAYASLEPSWKVHDTSTAAIAHDTLDVSGLVGRSWNVTFEGVGRTDDESWRRGEGRRKLETHRGPGWGGEEQGPAQQWQHGGPPSTTRAEPLRSGGCGRTEARRGGGSSWRPGVRGRGLGARRDALVGCCQARRPHPWLHRCRRSCRCCCCCSGAPSRPR